MLNPTPLTQQDPDFSSRENRERLAKMVTKLFEHWNLPLADQAALLGHSSDSRSTINRYRNGAPLADSVDLLNRVGHLLAIHKSLRIIFPYNRELAYRWVTTPNARFGGRAPIEIMKARYEGVLLVRRYLDFERGR